MGQDPGAVWGKRARGAPQDVRVSLAISDCSTVQRVVPARSLSTHGSCMSPWDGRGMVGLASRLLPAMHCFHRARAGPGTERPIWRAGRPRMASPGALGARLADEAPLGPPVCPPTGSAWHSADTG